MSLLLSSISLKVALRLFLPALTGLLPFLPATTRATVDDAYSYALESALKKVKRKRLTLRQDYLSGKSLFGQKTLLKQQLFEGNSYWFWLGVSEEGIRTTIDFYDPKGRRIKVRVSRHKNSVSFSVIPKKTGTYYLVFQASPGKKMARFRGKKGKDGAAANGEGSTSDWLVGEAARKDALAKSAGGGEAQQGGDPEKPKPGDQDEEPVGNRKDEYGWALVYAYRSAS